MRTARLRPRPGPGQDPLRGSGGPPPPLPAAALGWEGGQGPEGRCRESRANLGPDLVPASRQRAPSQLATGPLTLDAGHGPHGCPCNPVQWCRVGSRAWEQGHGGRCWTSFRWVWGLCRAAERGGGQYLVGRAMDLSGGETGRQPCGLPP